MEKLRIGKIPYLNLFPFFYFLEKIKEPAFEFIEDMPSRLNKKLRAGEIDVSPSSSIEYLSNQNLYEIIENHSISSTGPVKSIILFSKRPLRELTNKTLLVTDQSDTSIIQLEIIANLFLKLDIKTERSNLSLEQGLREYPAYLLIGDEAMKNVYLNKKFYIYDLGELWKIHTGLPFVYALWIIRREAINKKGILINKLKQELDNIKRDFLKTSAQICDLPEISNIIGPEEVLSYWKTLSFDLTEEHKKGLELFRHYAMILNQKRDSLSYP
ncbi:MAG: menaquinone biosynthesis protein [Thermodesulfovibrionales bacterium]